MLRLLQQWTWAAAAVPQHCQHPVLLMLPWAQAPCFIRSMNRSEVPVLFCQCDCTAAPAGDHTAGYQLTCRLRVRKQRQHVECLQLV